MIALGLRRKLARIRPLPFLLCGFALLRAGPANAQSDGEKLYARFCAACHAATGRGTRGLAPDLLTSAFARRTDAEIEELIRKGRAAKGMPAFGGGFKPEEIRAIVGRLRELQGVAPAPAEGAAPPAPADPGAPPPEAIEAGRALFGGKGRCLKCHSVDREGGLAGPDLTGLGGRMNAAEIYESIEFPSRKIARGFEGKDLVFKDGRALSGRFRNESRASIQLLDPEEDLWTTYFKRDLSAVRAAKNSIMPEGVLSGWSAEESGALLAFLRSLR